VLAEAGVEVDAKHVEDVTDVTGYEAVVPGSAVYMGVPDVATPLSVDTGGRTRAG
jgi:hypothetical protein